MKTRVQFLALGLLTAAITHAQFSMNDVLYWVGTGTDSTVLVIDFLDGNPDGSSYAWGYLHDGTATAEEMLVAIDAADMDLEIAIISGFVNDITYRDHAGIGGSPNWWGTWTGTGIADLAMNGGASEPLSDGEWFGCSYTDFDPAIAPGVPVAATNTTSIAEREDRALHAYPQPVEDLLYLDIGHARTAVQVFDATGRRMAELPMGTGLRSMDVHAWPAGMYVVHAGDIKRSIIVR
ncbi:MAG: T9SS type A sorting domain-containing protein [Flavobacteriales bacterium]|nr:T9SS type A sorting domain-containing protein [Flavobacteriales bacterium]